MILGSTARLITLSCVVAASSLAGTARSADGVTNPVYQSWERFPIGTAAIYKQLSEIGSTKYEATLSYTLVDRTRDKVVVEMQVTVRTNGVETRNRPMRMENLRSIALPPGIKPERFGKVEGMTAEGVEDLKAAGRDLKAKWYKARNKVEGKDNFVQSWSSDEVPGGLVKSISTTPASKSSMSMDLIEIKAP